MDDALSRRLAGEIEPSDEPIEEVSDMSNLGAEMVGGLAGLSALHASGWEPPADLEWQDEGDDWNIAPTVQEEASGTGIDARTLAIGAGLFLLAALPRIFVIFFVTDPQNPGFGWYNDVWHHWQIAFLSKDVGFSKGLLTLWDLKGMEYFWGLLHPLVLAILFEVTGSIDLVIQRLLSVVSASAAIVALFFILRRHYSVHVGLAAALLAALNPVSVFGDAAGMQEPLGLLLLFAGLALWPKRAIVAGLMLGFAGMARAEYWVFGAALVALSYFSSEESGKKLELSLGWAIPSLAYMKYLLDKTGNAIYPIYWNFRGTAAGDWMTDRPPTSDEMLIQWIARIVFVIAAIIAIRILQKRPKSYMFLLLGLGNILLLALMLGFTPYALGVQARILIGRLVMVPYLYLGVFVSILLMAIATKVRSRILGLTVAWALILVIGAAMQLAWIPVLNFYEERKSLWQDELALGREIASYYQGGSIAIHETRPSLTYILARYYGVPAESFQSQMYDPFYYFEPGDPFANWQQNREAVATWLTKLDIQLLVFPKSKAHYIEMVEREPEWFGVRVPTKTGTYFINEVDQSALH